MDPSQLYSTHLSVKFDKFIERLHRECGVSKEWLYEKLKDCNFALPYVKMSSSMAKNVATCTAILKSGENKNNPCGKSVSNKSESGQYCAMHVRLEKKDKVLAETDTINSQLVFRINKYGNFEFGQTGLVLKSQKDRKIIGKQVKDSVVDLNDDDIALCKQRKFKYIPNYSKTLQEREKRQEQETKTT
jgi:hypothetical protein